MERVPLLYIIGKPLYGTGCAGAAGRLFQDSASWVPYNIGWRWIYGTISIIGSWL